MNHQLKRWLSTTNHKEVGILYLITSLAFFVIGGILALMMRTQLARPMNDFLDADTYNQFVTMHGIIMLLFFLSPFAFAFGNYIVPIQIGARDLIFPRLNALSYWMYLAGGLVAVAGFFVGGAPVGGWTLYVPLTLKTFSPSLGVDFVFIGIILLVIGVTVSTINFLVTMHRLRAPGMRMYDMPLFSWAIYFTNIIMLFAFPALGIGAIMQFMERNLAFSFFDPSNGGGHLWGHVFWFFGHPEVYILLFPGMGAVLECIQTFSRRPIYGKKIILWALGIATFLSFIVYVHHMFTTGTDPVLRKFMVITTEMISVPFGVIYLSMIATMWKGSVKMEVPMLFAIGFILLFLIGGLTGVFLSSIAIDYGMHGTYWVVAHFHYAVLGGGVWGVLAALYFWYPKLTGKMFNEFLGKLHFWVGFIGFNMLFMSMFFFGKLPRWSATYPETMNYFAGMSLGTLNMIATIGAFMFGGGVILMLLNFIASIWTGKRAGHDPWGADGLEWTVSSPPPYHNFEPDLPTLQPTPAEALEYGKKPAKD